MALLPDNYYTNKGITQMTAFMRGCTLTILILGLLAMMSSPLHAAWSPTPNWDKRWQCGKEISIKKSTIQYLKKKKLFFAYQHKGKALPLLISQDYAHTGLILYTRVNKKWRAYPIAQSSIPMGVYSTSSHFRVAIFAMGGKHVFTGLNIKNQFRNVSCTHLPLPNGLQNKNMQYLTLQDFNVQKTGTGQLLGASYDASKKGSTKLRWFRYHTHNWGYSWDKPGPIKAPKRGHKPPGLFTVSKETPAPKWLINSLLRQAR